MSVKELFSYFTSALISEWTVLPLSKSPQTPILRLSSLPFSQLSVTMSVKVWVGWRCPPSPQLITGISEYREAAIAVPSTGWRIAIMSA